MIVRNRHIVILLIIVLTCGCASLPETDFSPDIPHVKIVSYNVNWGFVKPGNVADFLSDVDADVICMQETHRYWEVFLKEWLLERYPHSAFEGWGGAGGIAIMSKYKLEKVKLIEPKSGWFPSLLAEVRTPIGLVQFLNVHLKPPLSDEGTVRLSALYRTPNIHLKEIEEFVAKTDSTKPLVIAGDFNEDEGGKAIRWLNDKGFMDALSIYDTYTKTWEWKVYGAIRLKNRYDHIMVSKGLDCVGARVTKVDASDHMPVLAVIVPSRAEGKTVGRE
ncbi:MAG: endonuclease/exonuclease/phosphatase family protein [Planctomycetota bacterium]|jgi:endonuclease/exonuclease/phosphatase family metal-dependent hydrolase